ncbi:hypothetical protein LNTAR_19267 [Lentisphaera araneosa HTCC2155]|uniref:Uncharacterized protein n=1 Tax=Lentisphaera araneosa HTCC2155 TaxID=313628 RepID=A6DQR9_9BACT|nr:hypothetical protein [Lentisphaera araneosa]EDM25969.1 hypothetical protein LNTAR_19267 [Lentisphaera araneosa HTCC2155]
MTQEDFINRFPWSKLQEKVRDKLPTLFNNCKVVENVIDITIWIDSNGGLNFDGYQEFDNGYTLIRVGDTIKDWNDDLYQFDVLDGIIVEAFDNGFLDIGYEFDKRLQEIVKTEVYQLQVNNFGYPNEVKLNIKIQDEI